MKVLVAEDNTKMQAMLSSLLEKEGFDIVRAGGGREAMTFYREEKPDIICLDVQMDDMSGIDVCKEIRKTDSRVTIIMVTSKSADADVAAGTAAGANDYIAKPYDLSDISARIKRVVRDRIRRDDPARFAEYFDLGDLRVYPGQLRAERAGESMDLNFRDILILKHFRDHRGQPVNPDALRDYCWQDHPLGEAALVQWHMSQLRKKIEDDPDKPALIKPMPDGNYIYN